MSFIDFTNTPAPVLTTAQIWAQQTAEASKREWSDFFNFIETKYNEMWADKEKTPQDAIDRIAAMGTGAKAAFALHAAAVSYLASTIPFLAGADAIAAKLATLVVPTGWSLTFNPDGSAVVTAPQS